jgi:hypothetical protein
MITMFRTAKGAYQCFSSTLQLAQIARRSYPELKGGRITHVLQGAPAKIQLGHLYRWDEDQTDERSLRAKQGAVLGKMNQPASEPKESGKYLCGPGTTYSVRDVEGT